MFAKEHVELLFLQPDCLTCPNYGTGATFWAVAMAFELAAYGVIGGFLYNHSRWKCIVALYRSLIIAMIGGRVVWGIVSVVMYSMAGKAFTWQIFLAGAFLNAIPGIVLQLILIPLLMVALHRTGLSYFENNRRDADASKS